MRRVVLTLSVAAGLALPAQAVAQEVTTPAPPAEATGSAAAVDDLVAVGQTHARADHETGSAEAAAVEVQGQPPSPSFGGRASGNESAEGAFVDTGATPLGRARLAPWRAAAVSSTSARHAQAYAALADLTLVDPNVLTLVVLGSTSTADHDGLTSRGHASSDGAHARLGGDDGLDVVVLHAEADSTGAGQTYVLRVNDLTLLTQDDASACTIDASPLVKLVCLTVGGGQGAVTATVADLGVGGEEGLPAGAIGASGAGGEAPAPAPASVLAGLVEPSAPAPRASGGGGGTLAATGRSAGLVTLGISLLLVGAALELTRRRALPTG